MSRTLLAILTLATISTAAPAFAQDDVDAETGRKIKYKERTEIDFEGVDVNGELIKPSGVLLMDAKRSHFNPLIRFRENFDKEMKESLDEVK
jgi:hypothetical protein